jgi:hypothetical protein
MVAALFVVIAAFTAMTAEGLFTFEVKPKERPVAKVVELLKAMQTQLDTDAATDKDINDKQACWCSTNIKEKTKSIADGQQLIKKNTAEIEMLSGSLGKWQAEAEAVKKDISKAQDALTAVTTLREKQSQEFKKSESEMMTTLDQLVAAETQIAKSLNQTNKTSMLMQVQDMSAVRVQSIMAKLQKEVAKHAGLLAGSENVVNVDDFLRNPMYRSEIGGSFLQRAAAPGAGDALGVVKGVKEDWISNLADLRKKETLDFENYQKLSTAKQQEIFASQNQLTAKEQAVSKGKVRLVTAGVEIKQTQITVADDTAFLATLQEKCRLLQKEYEERLKTRADEGEAIAKTVEVLTSDDARDSFSKSFSFLQVEEEDADIGPPLDLDELRSLASVADDSSAQIQEVPVQEEVSVAPQPVEIPSVLMEKLQHSVNLNLQKIKNNEQVINVHHKLPVYVPNLSMRDSMRNVNLNFKNTARQLQAEVALMRQSVVKPVSFLQLAQQDPEDAIDLDSLAALASEPDSASAESSSSDSLDSAFETDVPKVSSIASLGADSEAVESTISEVEDTVDPATSNLLKQLQQKVALNSKVLSKNNEVILAEQTKLEIQNSKQPGYAQKQLKVKEPFAFLQEESSSDRRQAAIALSEVGKRVDARLIALALRVELDSFTRVLEAIDNMIEALNKEQADEVKHRDYCNSQLKQNQDEINSKNQTKSDLGTQIQVLGKTVNDTASQISVLKGEIAEAQKQLKIADFYREAENKEFQGVVVENRETQRVLKQAGLVLANYYNSQPKASLVEVSEHNIAGDVAEPASNNSTPPVAFKAYSSSAPGAQKVLDLLAKLTADSVAAEKEAVEAERTAQETYEKLQQETDTSIDAKNTTIASSQAKKSKAEADLAETTGSQNIALNSLKQLVITRGALRQDCDFVIQNFNISQQARSEEITALGKAKTVLAASPAGKK